MDIRLVGTIFEVEPILEPDGETIALSIELEHHSAPPVMKPLTNRTQVPQFHSNKITSHIQLRKGDYVLLGSWKPTGKPEYEEQDLTHVIFVTANVQPVGNYGLQESVEEPAGKEVEE